VKPITQNARLTSYHTWCHVEQQWEWRSLLGGRQGRRQGWLCRWFHIIRTASERSFYLHFHHQQNVWCYPWNHILTELC
jgi:hypothetical protein